MTASTPRTSPSSVTTTGMPPPPAAITMWPRLMSAAATSTPRTARGLGDATTLRQPRPASSTIVHPAVFVRSSARLLREKRPDGLRGLQERRVRGVDFDLRHDRHDLLAEPGARQLVVERELEQEPHRPFRLRHAEVERLRRDLLGGLLGLDEDVADLRAVAVDDDELVALADDRDELPDGLARPLELLGRRARVLRPQQRVAAEGDDGERADEGEEGGGVHRRTAAV